jgi:hypothetical protein
METISNKNGLVIISFPFPQGNENSIPIVVELNKGKWGERGARARARGNGKKIKKA